MSMMYKLGKWVKGSALVTAFTKNDLFADVTKHPYATATTPDQIIAAVLIESFAKNFDDWVFMDCPDRHSTVRARTPYRLLKNNKKETTFRFHYNGNDYYYDTVEHTYSQFTVNGVSLPDKEGRAVMVSYNKLANARKELKRKEAEALAEMKRNEAAWNLAEKLLGMKRNEHGALVPAVAVTEGE